jgi:translocation and assembly module TamA
VALPLEYVRDTRDSKLNPTSGTRLSLLVEPTYEINGGATFVKLRAEASAYRALDADKRFVLAGRVAAGTIYGASLASVPANRRFYAGGREAPCAATAIRTSVRSMPPDSPPAAVSLIETSAEIRIGVTDTIGLVPFVDAGLVSASETFSGAKFKAGAGIGVRYSTPFGPLRVDVAVPLNKDAHGSGLRIYAGIGQAF